MGEHRVGCGLRVCEGNGNMNEFAISPVMLKLRNFWYWPILFLPHFIRRFAVAL